MLTRLLKPRAARLALAIIFLPGILSGAPSGTVKLGDPFPDLGQFKLEGKLPEALPGKVVMVDFWASWCAPCKQSFPAMDELQKRHREQGLVIIAVNVDENREAMEAFLRKNPVTFTVVRDGKQKLVEKTGIGAMPSSFLIDRAGKVRFVHSGYRGGETRKIYQQEIETLLKEKLDEK